MTIDKLGMDTIFPTREAAQVVVDANAGDDWTYRVEPCVGGFTVSVYDETGEFLGNL